MPTAPSKLQRWLDVVAFLANRHFPVSTEDLWLNVPAYAAGVGGTGKEKQSIRRMFERDKDELRELGIPIETVIYSTNYGLNEEPGYRRQTPRASSRPKRCPSHGFARTLTLSAMPGSPLVPHNPG